LKRCFQTDRAKLKENLPLEIIEARKKFSAKPKSVELENIENIQKKKSKNFFKKIFK
jgi:hypothetical protein